MVFIFHVWQKTYSNSLYNIHILLFHSVVMSPQFQARDFIAKHYFEFLCEIFTIFFRKILLAKSMRSCCWRRLIAALEMRDALLARDNSFDVLGNFRTQLRGRWAKILFNSIWFSRSIWRICSLVNVQLRRVPFLNLKWLDEQQEKTHEMKPNSFYVNDLHS